MTVAGLRLVVLPGRFAICRLDSGAVPIWEAGTFFSATRTADVSDVVVGGRHVVTGGAHVRLDVAAALRAAIAGVGEPCGTS